MQVRLADLWVDFRVFPLVLTISSGLTLCPYSSPPTFDHTHGWKDDHSDQKAFEPFRQKSDFWCFCSKTGALITPMVEDAHLDQMALDGSSSFIARLRPRSMVHQHATPAHRHHHCHHHHHHRHHHWHRHDCHHHHHYHGAGWSTNMQSLFIACLWWGQWCFHIWWWRQERSSWFVESIQPPNILP